MTDRELMQQALEALELEDMACRYEKDPTPEHIAKAITALRERLAQPVQKPKPSATGPAELWLQLHGDSLSDEPVDFTDDTVTWCWHQIFDSDVRYVRADLAAQQPMFHLRSHGDVSAEELERLAQPVQEPWPDEPPGHIAGGVQEPVRREQRMYMDEQEFYTTPPLTDARITKIIDKMPNKMKGFMVDWDLYEFTRAIEAAHGIKGNA